MRIISGKYRGRKLSEIEGSEIRPTKDMVRESIFNILQSRVQGADVLDLFAGTGAVGLEAISRGAKSVVFVDASIKSCAVIKNNLKALNEEGEVHNVSALFALKKLNSIGRKFDIIYIDPPYDTELGLSAIDIIGDLGLLKKKGVILFEQAASDKREVSSAYYEVMRVRKYGKTKITELYHEEEIV